MQIQIINLELKLDWVIKGVVAADMYRFREPYWQVNGNNKPQTKSEIVLTTYNMFITKLSLNFRCS